MGNVHSACAQAPAAKPSKPAEPNGKKAADGASKKVTAPTAVKKDNARGSAEKKAKLNGATVKKPAKDAAQKPAADAVKPKAEGKKTDGKPKVEAADAAAVKPARVTKPKVVYDMPGQTKAKPDEEDPLCIFYTSLLKQRPESELANKWCAHMIE